MLTSHRIPLFFQFTQGDDALDAGVRILPLILLMITACMVNGAVLSKYGLYMPWYTTGGVLMAVGSGLMYTISSTDSASKVYGFSVLVGIGTGLFCQAGFSVAQAKVALADIPSSVGYIMCGQITGMTISITVANSIFLNEAEKGIAKLLPQLARDEIQNSIRGHGSEFVNSLPAELRAGVMDAVVKGLSNAYILCAVAGTLATILSLGLKRERLFTQ